MQTSLGALLSDSARRFGEKTALIVKQQHLSFNELEKASSLFASALQCLGIKKGDRVSLIAPNSIKWVISYYGILKAGAIVNPLQPEFTAEQAAHAINDCDATAVIGDIDLINPLLKQTSLTDLQYVIAFDETAKTRFLNFEQLVENAEMANNLPEIASDLPEIALDDLAAICYTSGTSGHPKGAMLSHRGLLMNAALMTAMHARNEQDTAVTALPCFHVYGVMVLNSAITSGMTLVLHARFDANTVLASIEEHQASLFVEM